MTKKTYRIPNVTCGGCAKAVTRMIERTTSRSTIDIDVDSRTLTVKTKDDFKALEEALATGGYPVQTSEP